MYKKLVTVTFLVVMLVVSIGIIPTDTANVQAQDTDMENTLVSQSVMEAPVLDGVADEDFWADAPVLEVEVRRGANVGETIVNLQSVYTEDMVYFYVTWADPTESYLRAPWEMQEDGTWIRLSDPDDMGGDNNLWYEDKFAFIWSINNSIAGWEEEGCFIACHRSEDGDPKPYGNKNTEEEGEMGDIWHWKSVRNLNQVHDQYLDHVQYSEDTRSAGRHSDPSDGGGYHNNINEAGDAPAYMPAGDDFPHDGSPGHLLESEMVPFDASLFEPGDRLPAIYISEFVGDGGDISAGWQWVDGVWMLEIGRALDTGSEYDVQFNDMAGIYYFGVGVFDNAQVRHMFHRDTLVFMFGE